MAKAQTATAGEPGTFDGDQPETVGALEDLTADPPGAWPAGSWVETTHGGERHWDGVQWQQGRAPGVDEAEAEVEDDGPTEESDIQRTARLQRLTGDY